MGRQVLYLDHRPIALRLVGQGAALMHSPLMHGPLMLGPPSAHGGTQHANAALGASFNTAAQANLGDR